MDSFESTDRVDALDTLDRVDRLEALEDALEDADDDLLLRLPPIIPKLFLLPHDIV